MTYKLYAVPGYCSLGIHALLNAIDADFEIIMRDDIDDFTKINPVGAVPVLEHNGHVIREGGAIALYLLERHNQVALPNDPIQKSEFLQKLFFNYATLHPAYSKLFFAMLNLEGHAQEQAYVASAEAISKLWKIVDDQLAKTRFLGGNKVSILDYLLCVYANWGNNFDVKITLGKNVERLINETIQTPEFQKALQAENIDYKIAA